MPPRSRLQSEKAARRIRRAKQILWTTFSLGILASVVLLIAMSTTGWVSVELPPGTYRNSTHSYVLSHYAGLWRKCWSEWDNSSSPIMQRKYCRMRKFFPSQNVIENDPEIDHTSLDLSRSVAAFSVISLLLSAIPNFFTWYSIQEPRYIYKRLAGALHFITAGCVVMCIEVFRGSVDHHRSQASSIGFPAGSVFRYGFAMYLAWTSLALFVLVGIAMFVLSAKRKGDKARSNSEAFENEPVIIGRI